MHFISADKIFNGRDFLPENSVLVLNHQKQFVEIITKNSIDSGKILTHQGIITPGFVNAHCHTELSHLKNKISQKKGLIEFAKQVILQRNSISKDEIKEHIKEADKEMFKNGIVLVGDICNTNDSLKMKESSGIMYHSFIELLGFNPAKTNDSFEAGIKLLNEFTDNGFGASLAPHAPYSTSKDLIHKISEYNCKLGSTSSIHNQESEEENKLFMGQKSEYQNLFDFLKIDISWFSAPKKSSLEYYQEALSQQQTLLVHNTYTSIKDIELIHQKNIYWCFCPNANLYIENKLPDFNLFSEFKNKMCLGTDSLASNGTLSVLNEANVLIHNSAFTLTEIFRAITFNAAASLNLSHKFGSFIPNKNAGLNLLEYKKNKISLISKLT